MKPKTARTVHAWHPPRPGVEDPIYVSVGLRPWEYQEVLRFADAHGLTEADVLRTALRLLFREVVAKQTGFHGVERRANR